MPAVFRPLPQLAQPKKRPKKPPIKGSRQVRFAPKKPNYQDIKEGVYAAIAQLPAEQRNLIPASGTLPEQMVGLALMWLNLPCQAQINSDGGRLRLGGSVVAWLVFLGSKTLAVRVQGDYWHSLPSRKLNRTPCSMTGFISCATGR